MKITEKKLIILTRSRSNRKIDIVYYEYEASNEKTYKNYLITKLNPIGNQL